MKTVLCLAAPEVAVIDLFADAPAGDPKASAHLLAAYAAWFPTGTVFLCVVDPGVGGTRPAVIVEANGRWYVGPGNGLFELVLRRASMARRWDIEWKPERLSASFHGRDLFAPVAGMLARGESPPGQPRKDDADRRPEWPDDLCEIAYVDQYGNAITGLRAAVLPSDARLAVAGRILPRGGLSAICRKARPSGMRIQTGWRKSPSIRVALAANSVLRSAPRSRSSLEDGGHHNENPNRQI